MSDYDFSIQASTKIFSNEMQNFLENSIFILPNWKWLVLIFALISLHFIRLISLSFFKKLKESQSQFENRTFVSFLLTLNLEKGLSWIFTSIIGLIIVDNLNLTESINKYLFHILKIILYFNLFQLLYLAADAFGKSIHELAKNTDSKIDDQLAPLATKTLKVLIVIFGILFILKNLGQDVTALLAGLGIGGVALAFAAQDTVANVFGTITIILDSPFKLGDRIKLGDTEGIVEEVGFRSTRIRTFYNSLITIPNSVVAKERIDNLSDRNGWIRFRTVLNVTYDSPLEKIIQFTENLKYRLMQDPNINREKISIHLTNFNESSIDILVVFHFFIKPEEDESLRNQIYLQEIHNHLKECQISFAFPTRTLIIKNNNLA
jgi:MscS family membrane protein